MGKCPIQLGVRANGEDSVNKGCNDVSYSVRAPFSASSQPLIDELSSGDAARSGILRVRNVRGKCSSGSSSSLENR